MAQDQTYLIVDAGNTQVKLVYFQADNIVSSFRYGAEDLSEIKKCLKDNLYSRAILSSVQSDEATAKLSSLIRPEVVLSHKTSLPIDFSAYKTLNTLGTDRIANAVAANHLSSNENALVVDIGTCIKYDLVIQGKYQGGGISPGMNMRFKALHDYTGQLPALEFEENATLVGESTKEAMLSGVIQGMSAEINGIVERYTQQFQLLTIFLTGGDAKRFDKALKNSIFADGNLTVKGLYLILKHNG
jgi:type III pantothenate kinase